MIIFIGLIGAFIVWMIIEFVKAPYGRQDEEKQRFYFTDENGKDLD